MTPKEILTQLNNLTTTVVGLSLSNDQNFPTTLGKLEHDFEITLGGAERMSVAMRNIAYSDIYRELEQARCFNFKMLDGALVGLRYRFSAGKVISHILSYFPAPDLEHFQNEPEVYLLDEIYADVIGRNIVPFPLRFDFNSDATLFVDVDHPYSHLSLGQYENCRIPVSAPLSPATFGGFILRNFYNTAFRKYSDKMPASIARFATTITENERKILHVVLG